MMYNVVKYSLIAQLKEEFKVANTNIVNLELPNITFFRKKLR